MIFTLAYFPVVVAILFVYGQGVRLLYSKLIGKPLEPRASFGEVVWVGLAFLSGLGGLMSLVLPMSALALGLVCLGGIVIGYFLWQRKLWNVLEPIRLTKSRLQLLFLAILILSVLDSATHAPANPDTSIYHAQTIRWMET